MTPLRDSGVPMKSSHTSRLHSSHMLFLAMQLVHCNINRPLIWHAQRAPVAPRARAAAPNSKPPGRHKSTWRATPSAGRPASWPLKSCSRRKGVSPSALIHLPKFLWFLAISELPMTEYSTIMPGSCAILAARHACNAHLRFLCLTLLGVLHTLLLRHLRPCNWCLA